MAFSRVRLICFHLQNLADLRPEVDQYIKQQNDHYLKIIFLFDTSFVTIIVKFIAYIFSMTLLTWFYVFQVVFRGCGTDISQ